MRYQLETWGCQMNVHDSEKIAGILEALGYRRAESAEEADIVLLNTCSIREKAAQKIFTRLGRLRELKRANPDLILAVCGCVAQQEKEALLSRAPFVDLVIGPKCYGELGEILQSRKSAEKVIRADLDGGAVAEPRNVVRESPVKAYVTIMEGCDNYCAYCVVPYVRGREISRPFRNIHEEVLHLAGQGCKEVHLLGQNVNSYRHEDLRFPELLARLDAVRNVRRIRFTTSHPKDFDQDLIDVMAGSDKICDHIHLPVQSGSTRVLERMNRGYSAGAYRGKIEALRAAIPHIAITTDLIVGFPGETEEDFLETLSLVRDLRFDGLFSFKYSPRPLTAASRYPDTIPLEEKKRRLEALHALHQGIQEEKQAAFVGREVEVLIDGCSRKDSAGATGRTSDHKVVNFEGGTERNGEIVRATILAAHRNSLSGKILETD